MTGIYYDERKCVYAFECEGFFKIGVALHPTSRRDALQMGNPFKIKIVSSYSVDAECARYIEKWLHRELQEYHVRGEWFSAPKDEVLKLMRLACRKLHARFVDRWLGHTKSVKPGERILVLMGATAWNVAIGTLTIMFIAWAGLLEIVGIGQPTWGQAALVAFWIGAFQAQVQIGPYRYVED